MSTQAELAGGSSHPRVNCHKLFVMRAKKRWLPLQKPILISWEDRLVSGIHWVLWTRTFGDLAMSKRLDTCVMRRLSMVGSQWLHSSVTSCSQRRWSLGPITYCHSEDMSPASPRLSSGMPSPFTA